MSTSNPPLSRMAILGFLSMALSYPLFFFARGRGPTLEIAGVLFFASLGAALILTLLGLISVVRSDGQQSGLLMVIATCIGLVPWALMFIR